MNDLEVPEVLFAFFDYGGNGVQHYDLKAVSVKGRLSSIEVLFSTSVSTSTRLSAHCYRSSVIVGSTDSEHR